MLYTTNGGATWNIKAPLTSNHLNAMHFNTALEGWVCGDGGVILHTADGGTNWALCTSPSTNRYLSIYFKDVSTGFILDSESTILKTLDGGTTWDIWPTIITNNFTTFSYLPAENALLVAGYYGSIIKLKFPLTLANSSTTNYDVTVSINGEPNTAFIKLVLKDGVTYSWPTSNRFVENGTYTITATQRDRAGNESSPASFTFTISR